MSIHTVSEVKAWMLTHKARGKMKNTDVITHHLIHLGDVEINKIMFLRSNNNYKKIV